MMTNITRFTCIVSLFVFFLLTCHNLNAAGQDTISLYPGISLQQHEIAQRAMHEFFAQHWDSAEASCLEMRRLEQGNSLLPMSFMLRFAMRVWRILNNEVENPEENKAMYRELDPLRDECVRILHKHTFPDSTLATRLFLEGGINGFNATLKIRSHPFAAMVSGLHAVRMLESAHALSPCMDDVYLGLGVSQCALANEPGIIRVAMRLFNGLHVNLDTGLVYLRICSAGALYTKDGARQYLVQFLSPFKDREIREKQEIFKEFQSLYPDDPYYVFQEIDEGMAFHRQEVFSKQTIDRAMPLIEHFDTSNFSLRRYANLVKWQCAMIDFSLTNELHPEPIAPKRCFSFYPVFLSTAREQYLLVSSHDMSRTERKNHFRQYRYMKDKAVSMLWTSDINPMLREYFLYHIQDGLP
jgi:hypothetical protein